MSAKFRAAATLVVAITAVSNASCQEPRRGGERARAAPALTARDAEQRVMLSFYSSSDDQFEIGETYYVAANEPGASNNNNGRFPSYHSGTDGPFKDLNDSRIRSLLAGERGVKMILREGVYRLERLDGSDSGVILNGSGDERRPIILAGHPGETAILDGGETLTRDQLLGIRGGESYDIEIQQTVTLEGRYNILENLTIRDGFRYNVLVLGKYSIVRGNRLQGAFEDSIKTVEGADYGLIANNEISGFASQGIDSFGSTFWLVKNNDIHHPQLDPVTDVIEANGIGGKGGVEDYVIIGNDIHDFDTNRRVGALAFGGGGDLSLYRKDALRRLRPAATRIMAFGNTIRDYNGPAVYFQSCSDCMFVGNTVSNTLGGASLGLAPDEYEAKTNRGLPMTRNATIRDNRFVGNHAGLDVCREGGNLPVGTTCFALFINSLEAADGLMAEGNVYFSDTPPRFALRSDKVVLLTRDELRDRLGVEQTSEVRPLDEFER
jgi:hypothetical protein